MDSGTCTIPRPDYGYHADAETRQSPAWLWFALIIGAITYGTLLRLENVADRGLEYDEIWTLINYAGTAEAVFTDLSTPNNHPLHSLAVHWSIRTLGESPLTIRLPALAAGLAAIVIAALIAHLLFQDLSATAYVTAFFALNGFLVHYSRTARGYSMQVLALTVFLLLIVVYEKQKNRAAARTLRGIALSTVVAAAAAILILPTSVIYLAVIAAGHLGLVAGLPAESAGGGDRKPAAGELLKSRPHLISAYGAIFLFSLLWYSVNYRQYRLAQEFGTVVRDPGTWFDFARQTLTTLTPWPYLILLVVPFLIAPLRKQAGLTGAAILVPLLAALVSRAGPPRAYLPLQLFMAGGGALAIVTLKNLLQTAATETSRRAPGYDRLARGAILPALVLSLFFSASPDRARHTPVDWRKTARQFTSSFDQNTFLAYPGGAGYPILHNNFPDIIIDNYRRGRHFGRYWLQIGTPGRISGTDARGRSIELPVRGYEGKNHFSCFALPCDLYSVSPISAATDSGNLIAVIGPLPRPEINDLLSLFLQPENTPWIRVNPWLVDTVAENRDSEARAVEVVFSNQPARAYEQLRKIESNTADAIRFFQLVPWTVVPD